MGLVRGRDTKPELRVRKALYAAGLRFRLQARDLPGRPDIVFRSRRIAIFVHGCFWHRHPDPECRLTRTPKTRIDFWEAKFEGNVTRDERNQAALRDLGWTVIIIWECQLADGSVIEAAIDTVKNTQPRSSG